MGDDYELYAVPDEIGQRLDLAELAGVPRAVIESSAARILDTLVWLGDPCPDMTWVMHTALDVAGAPR
jgi:hypothetical protein